MPRIDARPRGAVAIRGVAGGPAFGLCKVLCGGFLGTSNVIALRLT